MHNIVNDLQNRLFHGRINKIYQISNYELLINVRANHTNEKLLISCHPTHARVALTYQKYPTPQVAPQFVMLLRKHLEGSHIQKIEQIELDRVMKITILSRNELGDLVSLYIYIEIMGKHSNFILCNQNGKIIDCLKRISPSQNTIRFLQPGANYELPPMQPNKLNPITTTEFVSDNLNKTFQGISPILSKELLYRMDQGENFHDIITQILHSKTLYITNINGKRYFHLIPLLHLHGNIEQIELYLGLDQFFFNIDTKERIKQQTANLERFIHQELQKNILKLQKLQLTLDDSVNSDEFRIKGDLLFASLHLIQKGMNQITVPNYYDDSFITIELDPRFDGKTNAKKYYTKYQKAKNSISVLNEQIRLTNEEIDYFDTLLTQMQRATFEDALEIKQELEMLGYLRKSKTKGKTKDLKPCFKKYMTKENIELYIGKNNIQNDYLTFKYAKKDYYWFHAKNMPGSHVVIATNNPNEYLIRLAAKLAAYYSKGKLSSSVPVNYTTIRSLKRPNHGKPGQVILDQYKTIYIDPDEDCIKEIDAL